ncbi:MAG: hypothetical protein ACOY3U_02965 [Bacillota bacterium]|uniref:hypothetical protein n=1 Tax=Desulforamulus profundi TaxID=1383067 RepID=UPI000BFFED3E|nr:hypothetical protein [Desulforamulus profundi]
MKDIIQYPPEILSEDLKHVLESTYKTDVLYRSKGSEALNRLQELLRLCAQLLNITKSYPDIHKSNAVCLVQRFLEEQATCDSEGKWTAKENKDITADSLQSAYDPDATYRKKPAKGIPDMWLISQKPVPMRTPSRSLLIMLWIKTLSMIHRCSKTASRLSRRK